MSHPDLPVLPFGEWTDTRITLHLIFQIMGKTRLKLTPRKNHWWYITLYITPRGFSTQAIPLDRGLQSLEIELDVRKKAVVITHSDQEQATIELYDGLSVSSFYRNYMETLNGLQLHPGFVDKPFDMGIDKPFELLEEYSSYDWEYINRFWKLMLWNNSIFQEFSGRFYGKTCPVHLYWHHMDLAVTRFSGEKLAPMDKSARISDKDAYSHEQISFGFWVGDNDVQEPMYYSYTYPSPEGIDHQELSPPKAFWQDANGSPMALLRYEDVSNSANPRGVVLDFLESAYQAGANLAGWDVKALKTPSLDEL